MLINLSSIHSKEWNAVQTVMSSKYGGVVDIFVPTYAKDMDSMEQQQFINVLDKRIRELCKNFKVLNAVLLPDNDVFNYLFKEKLNDVKNICYLKPKIKNGKFVKYMEV